FLPRSASELSNRKPSLVGTQLSHCCCFSALPGQHLPRSAGKKNPPRIVGRTHASSARSRRGHSCPAARESAPQRAEAQGQREKPPGRLRDMCTSEIWRSSCLCSSKSLADHEPELVVIHGAAALPRVTSFKEHEFADCPVEVGFNKVRLRSFRKRSI